MSQTQVKMVVHRFNNDQSFDCLSMGNMKGVRRLTIRNIGTTVLMVKDDGNEPIEPGETFTINSDLLVTNRKLELEFVPEVGMSNDGIIRYLVDVCQ